MENLKVIVEASARHVHVSRDDLETLFGKGYQLTNKRELSQPGQYLTEEKLSVTGPRGTIDRVSILGPERPVTQVEVSMTDARVLGVTPPIRESGVLGGSESVKLTGPAGSVVLKEGAIVAKRHVHLTPGTAEKYGIADKEIVRVRIEGERALVFDEVVARVNATYADAMHVDYDEANAAALQPGTMGIVEKR